MFDIEEFERTVSDFQEAVQATPAELASLKLSEDFWSLKEILGHLVDSASNNHQRFVRLQEATRSRFPAYDGESWVAIQRYRDADWNGLVELWAAYNRLLLWLVRSIDPSALTHVWEVGGEEHTLEWVVGDYYRHLRWHSEHYASRLAELRKG
jgi:hypothetical protein